MNSNLLKITHLSRHFFKKIKLDLGRDNPILYLPRYKIIGEIQLKNNDFFVLIYGFIIVMDAAEGASLLYGFSREVSEEEFEERIRNNTLPEVLNRVMIHKGDVLFIDPGTIHAIGAGSLIAEIQQNSNVTYRVYDYGRKGPDGKERELHVDKALQVTKREPAATDRDFGPHVASCEYFTVDKVILDGLRRKKLTGEADGTSFVSVLVMSGAGKITASGETMEVKKGDSIFITAGSGEYELEGDMEALLTTV